jgi:uncharacterized membrane protein (DUF106 family)
MTKKRVRLRTIIIAMFAVMIVASLWNSLPLIKNSVHYLLDPSFGYLLKWNLYIGMIIIALLISIITSLIQKYTTDQAALKEIKEGQKKLQEEMKKFQKEGNTAKIMELQKQQFASMPEMMKLSMSSIIYTGVPFVLFFRWFDDFFTTIGNPTFFGFMNWFWFYLILLMITGGIFRKVLKIH